MRVMKLVSGIGGSVAITMLALALTPLVALASGPGTSTSNLTNVSSGYVADSTGGAEAMSNAEFTVTPGPLSLNQVPNIVFGSVSVKDVASADTSAPLSTGTPTGGTGYDGNNNGTLNVTDYRGDHDGWSLTVGMSPFTSGANSITNAQLTLDETAGTLDNTATAAPMSLTLPQSAVTNDWISSPKTLWTAAADSGEGSNSATTAASSKLTITKQPDVSAGTYNATLYWALQNAPAATTPAQ